MGVPKSRFNILVTKLILRSIDSFLFCPMSSYTMTNRIPYEIPVSGLDFRFINEFAQNIV